MFRYVGDNRLVKSARTEVYIMRICFAFVLPITGAFSPPPTELARGDQFDHFRFFAFLVLPHYSLQPWIVASEVESEMTGVGGLKSQAWLHSDLPDHCFIEVHAESWNVSTSEWQSGCPTSQPFRSTVDAENRGIYWHKDDSAR